MADEHSGGERVGGYQVVRTLDPSGGMGQNAAVAVSREGSHKGRFVVLKRTDARGPRARRVRKEIDNVARLRHLANVEVLEHFDHDKELFVVFSHDQDGPRLDQMQAHLIRQGERLADGAILFLGHQLLNALAEAHDQQKDGNNLGMVHGFLGPDLIRVTWDGRVRLVGLGLPSLFDDTGRAEELRAYRAPEHNPARISRASADVYSVAAILWTLFTGRRPPTDKKGFPKLGLLRKDIPATVAMAIDKGLTRTPSLRKMTCRDLAGALEKEVRGIADPTELKWNMEVFRALSLFAGSQIPADSLTPGDSVPPAHDDWVPAPIPSRPSGTGPEPQSGWKTAASSSGGKGSAEDSVIQRLTDLFDALPAEPSRPGPSEDRQSVDAGWDIEDDTEARDAERFSEVGSAPRPEAKPRARPKKDTPAPPTTAPPTEPDMPTLPVSDSAPPTEPMPSTEPSLDEMRDTRADPSGGARAKRSPTGTLTFDDPLPKPKARGTGTIPLDIIEEPQIGTKTSQPPVSSEQVPSTEPAGGRMAAPPPSPQSHKRAIEAKRSEAVAQAPAPPAPPPQVIRKGVPASTVAAIAIACLGVGFGAAWQLKPTSGAPAATAPADDSSTPSPAPTKRPPVKPPTSAAPPPATRAEPSPTPSAETSAAPKDPEPSGDVDLPPIPTGDGKDGSELLSYQGYLIIRSSAKAEIFVQGKNIGATNQKLLSRCQQRNVRLRDSLTARWITKGQSVDITCMATTTVVIHPDP